MKFLFNLSFFLSLTVYSQNPDREAKITFDWWINQEQSSPIQIDPNRFLTVYTDNLEIPTYDSLPNETHFNYIYFDTPWNGFKYWAIFTPYPFESRENPSVIVSNTGRTWQVPPGGSNPIALLNTGDPYYSDPDLVYKENENLLYAFYRYTDVNTNYQEVRYKTTSDGITWSAYQVLTSGIFQTQSSFSFQLINNNWFYWYVDTQGGGSADYEIYLITSSTLAGISTATPQLTNISPINSTLYHNWQFDVFFDTDLNQYVGAFVSTLKGTPPNNGGVVAMGTSLDGINWTIADSNIPYPASPAQYLLSLGKTAYSEKNGAQFEIFQSVQYTIKNSLLWLKDTVNYYAYDSISNIESIYSSITRLNSFDGMPVVRVVRDSDGDSIDVFYNAADSLLYIASGTLLSEYKGVSTLRASRIYNQKGNVDYLVFDTLARPIFYPAIWNGSQNWGFSFDGINDVGEDYIGGLFDYSGITFANYLTGGRAWTVKSGSNYFGIVTGSNIGLLNGTNITSQHLPTPQIYSGFFGTGGTSKILRNNTSIITGSTSVPSINQKAALGAQWASTVYSNFFTGIIGEAVLWNATPSNDNLTEVINTQIQDFNFLQDTVVYDTYNDVNGTAIASHIPNIRPGSNTYSSSGGTWTIENNKLDLSGASGTPVCTIDSEISDGIFSGTIDPGGSGGSGLVFRYTDINNFLYVRLFSGTTLGVFKYTAGVFSTVATSAVAAPGEPYTLGVQLVGNIIRVFLNGTLVFTTNSTDHLTATRIGWVTNTAEGNTTTFDNLLAIKWFQ